MRQLATIAAFGFADLEPAVILDLYRRLGCTTCQFYRNEALAPTDDEVLEACGVAMLRVDSMHGLFGAAYDPSSPNEARRRDAVRTYRGEGALAARLGGAMVVVHPAPAAPEGVLITNTHRRQRYDPLFKSLQELAAIGRSLGVVYLIENLTGHYWFGHDPLELADMIRAVDSRHLRMCFDVGHAHLTGSVADRLVACRDVIEYLHIHDNDGQSDGHLMPCDGVIDWEEVGLALRASELEVPAMLEVFYGAEQLAGVVDSDLPDRLVHWFSERAVGAHVHPAG